MCKDSILIYLKFLQQVVHRQKVVAILKLFHFLPEKCRRYKLHYNLVQMWSYPKMNQRYEILYKNNEFLQEYLGCDMGVLKTTGKELVNSSMFTKISNRIMKEHWKASDIPVSPAKILLWSNDKNCKISQISASHLLYGKIPQSEKIWGRRGKLIYSDLINQNFGAMLAGILTPRSTASINASVLDTAGISDYISTSNSGVSNFNQITTGAGFGIEYLLGTGSRTGNLRIASSLQNLIQTLDTSSASVMNTTSGLLSNGMSWSANTTATLTEVGTQGLWWKWSGTAGAQTYLLTYDLVNFPIIPAQIVNMSLVI